MSAYDDVSDEDFFTAPNALPLTNSNNSNNNNKPPPVAAAAAAAAAAEAIVAAPSESKGKRKRGAATSHVYHHPDPVELQRLQQKVRSRRGDASSDDGGGRDDNDRGGRDDDNDDDDDEVQILTRSRSLADEQVDRLVQFAQRTVSDVPAHPVVQLQERLARERLQTQSDLRETESQLQALRSSSAVAVSAAGANIVLICVRQPRTGVSQKVRVKRTETLSRIVKAVCAGLQPPLTPDEQSRIVALVDRRPVSDLSATIADLQLEDNDVVDLHLPPAPVSAAADALESDDVDGDAGADDARVQLCVCDKEGNDRSYRLRPNDVLSKLMRAYCDEVGCRYSEEFEFDGEHIDGTATVRALGLEDDDLITFLGNVHDAPSAPPTPETRTNANGPRVTLRVRDKSGNEEVFTLLVSDPLQKLFTAYCATRGVADSTNFEFDGSLVDPDGTAQELGLEDDDLITFIG